MPTIFNVIDSRMTQHFAGNRSETIAAGMPEGIIDYGQKWVKSVPVSFAHTSSTCFLLGRLDTLIKLDDGSYGVIDFKTAERKAEHIPLYGRQLHAYAHALENAAPGEFSVPNVTKLGLLVFEPNAFDSESKGGASLSGSLSWIEIPRDESSFHDFLREVVSLLDEASPPYGAPSCKYCEYRDKSRTAGI